MTIVVTTATAPQLADATPQPWSRTEKEPHLSDLLAAADKDHYDLVYVLLHHKAGTGPRGAAEALLTGPFRRNLPSLENRFRELASRFSQDAISAVQEFTRPLIERGGRELAQ